MKFSIIIPLFNKADTISRAIDSIKSQTYYDYEIIVVNDGSTDNPHKVLDGYPEIVLIDKINGGVSSARNAGIDIARGKYVCFLDADDLWLDNHLSELLKMIQKYPDSGVYITSHIEVKDDVHKDSSEVYPKSFPNIFETDNYFHLLNVYGDGIIHTNSVCIKKQIIDAYHLRFDTNSKLGEDVDMWFRAALKSNVTISKIATTSYLRDFSTATKDGCFMERWIFAKRNDDIKNDPDIPSYRKYECLKMIDRNRLYTCREYIKNGDNKNAEKIIKLVNYKEGKNYFITKLLLALPFRIARYIINLR
ncbi:MAG: glycosyltransferase [Bacteroidales bacterium]|nr:glycosyltransferase [Bacteroidales bacterium]